MLKFAVQYRNEFDEVLIEHFRTLEQARKFASGLPWSYRNIRVFTGMALVWQW